MHAVKGTWPLIPRYILLFPLSTAAYWSSSGSPFCECISESESETWSMWLLSVTQQKGRLRNTVMSPPPLHSPDLSCTTSAPPQSQSRHERGKFWVDWRYQGSNTTKETPDGTSRTAQQGARMTDRVCSKQGGVLRRDWGQLKFLL